MSDAKMKRRTLLGTAGFGMLAAPTLLSRPAMAQADTDMKIDHAMPPQTNRFKLGSLEIVVIQDGIRVSGAPGETYGTNQKPQDVAALLDRNFLPTDQLVNGFSPVLVNTGSDIILFDTGLGEGARAQGGGRLVEGMAAAGYTREDVTIVVLTHMHGDHIGGLMEKSAPSFANARYVTGQREYDFWVDPARMGSPAENGHKGVVANVKPLADKMTFVGDGGEVVPGITGMNAFGHTPGHMIYRLESGGRQLVLTADTANHYVLSLERPDWEVRFDMDKAAAAASRRKVFDMIAADKLAFLGYHMPFPSVGFVEKHDVGYRYVPKTYQFDL